jgi:hypothetical protein
LPALRKAFHAVGLQTVSDWVAGVQRHTVSPKETVCRSYAVYRQLRPRASFSLSLPT